MTRKQRFRLRHVFWLDMLDEAEQAIAEYVEELKAQRNFATTIRDGLRLMRDLRSGNIEVLCELFPFIRAQLHSPQTPPTDTDLKREFDTLKELLLHSTTPPMVAVPVGAPRMLQSVAGAGMPQALNVPKFDLPRFDDEDDAETLILTKDTRTDSAANFLNSMLALQQ